MRIDVHVVTVFSICSQHQQQVAAAVERAKQVTMQELNAIIGVSTSTLWQGPYRALKVLKSLEFDWTKFKAFKSLNFTK